MGHGCGCNIFEPSSRAVVRVLNIGCSRIEEPTSHRRLYTAMDLLQVKRISRLRECFDVKEILRIPLTLQTCFLRNILQGVPLSEHHSYQ